MRALVVLLVLSLFACSATAGPKGKKPKDKPKKSGDHYPLRPNDTWRYRWTTADGKTGEFETRAIAPVKEGDVTYHLVERKTGKTTLVDWYSRPEGWLLVHKQVNPTPDAPQLVFQPPRQMLKLPLKTGESWSWEGTGLMGMRIKENNTVEAEEEVSVPAGKFHAIRVATSITQGDTITSKTWWFAGGVGMVKSATDNGTVKSTTELVESSRVKKD